MFFSILLLSILAATLLSTMNDYLDSPLLSSFVNQSKSKIDAPETPQEITSEKTNNGLRNQILSCFSVKRNISSLFGLEENDAEIKCLHGLKAVSVLLLFISLKLISMGRVPYSNRNKLTEFFNSPLSVFLRSSFLYEDIFLLVSGMLASLSLLKGVTSGVKTFWLKKIVKRYFRLVVPLAIVLLFYAYVWEHLGVGPQWSVVVDKNADLCKQNLWRNLFFVQNFYPFEDMVRSTRSQRLIKL